MILLVSANRQRKQVLKFIIRLISPIRIFGEMLSYKNIVVVVLILFVLTILNVLRISVSLKSSFEYTMMLFWGYGLGYFDVMDFLQMVIINGLPIYILAIYLENKASMRNIVMIRYKKIADMNTVIKRVGVSKSFNGVTLFSNVNLEIEQGLIVGFRGINGSGKSVLFKIIAGLYLPDAGDVYIRGEKLGDKIDFPDEMGILVDTPGFIEIFSGADNLRLLAEIKGRIGRQEITVAMKELGLDPDSKKRVKNYSLGMKQKLGIIQATMEKQTIVLLDEPFNALDKESNQYLYDLILRLKHENVTVLLTSHNQMDLDALCDVQYAVPTFNC